MVARIVIIVVAVVGLIPGWIFSYAADNPNPLLYLLFAPIFPFLGTCPFPFDASNGLGLGDIYYWPILPCLTTIAMGIFGFIKKSKTVALIFTGAVVLSWGLTYIRCFTLAPS
jgi:hypothetical protein